MRNNIVDMLKKNPDALVEEASRRRLVNFAQFMNASLDIRPFHRVYYTILDMFAKGKIKKLIVQQPPQHGKSEGSTRNLPAFMMGLNPDLKIVIGSYSSTVAKDFNRDVERIIDTADYHKLFPDSFLSRSKVVTMANTYRRNTEVLEMVGHRGSLRFVGRGGALTSKTVDVSILDDVYKDYAEGNSPVIRKSAWKWYTTVVRTRLHNDSQELIVFTRWNEDDLIGKLERVEKVVDVKTWDDIENIERGAWVRINFQAIKEGEPTELDPRETGTALWPERHSLEKLLAQKALDPVQFQCLQQGNPSSAEGRLYGAFKTYTEKTEYGTRIRSGNYTDVADDGSDSLVSICYEVRRSPNTIYNEHTRRYEPLLFVLVTDALVTEEDTNSTSISVPDMMNRNGTQKAYIEANNGGSGYKKIIEKRTKAECIGFHQTKNKESRLLTYAGPVTQHIVFPHDWQDRFPKLYNNVTSFLRDFGANEHDDCADTLTGIYEKEVLPGNTLPYGAITGVRIVN